MSYNIIPAALFITLIIAVIFSFFSKRPFRGLWIFILIIFLATWSGQLWIMPFGPVSWGVAWIPLVMVSLFFTFLIFALVSPVPVTKKEEARAEEGAAMILGSFFWIILILLITSIIVGYYRV